MCTQSKRKKMINCTLSKFKTSVQEKTSLRNTYASYQPSENICKLYLTEDKYIEYCKEFLKLSNTKKNNITKNE